MVHTEDLQLRVKALLEEKLKECMRGADDYNKKLWEAMEYSLTAGGKRIRPMLLMLTGLSLGAKEEDLVPFALSLEMIHTYSLIHDDLPAMDNDDYRRGRLTNHKVYGEAAAILAGDGLLTLAFETMGKALVRKAQEGDVSGVVNGVKAMEHIAGCAGCSGMIAGQIADLKAEGRQIGRDELTYIEFNKTSRLLMAALTGGAKAAGADESIILHMENAGGKIGEAFQIIDDILDEEGTLEELGKLPGSDRKEDKATFITLYGPEEARKRAALLTEEALEDLKVLPGEAGEIVRNMAKAMLVRRN